MINKFDMSAGGWRPVSPFLFEDERLALDTKAVAGFISTRSESFTLSAAGLRKLLHIGDGRWKRICDELVNAGYLIQKWERVKMVVFIVN